MNILTFVTDAGARRDGWLARSSDLLLAAAIVAIVALMILPLPALAIDMLVATNMVVGVMLVLMGIYVTTALQFSTFPSVLLISTLFRLALSVATTRMILLHGDAGHIIQTFGDTVAGGNLVVGLVVFLIITLVQFLVIAKGAERVAEVGARFTLDAMPGKQLSIDSDLRSGLIDKHEARHKRRELELESKLHGSMDGAMKFVKGDAIAGIVIIVVNLLGGLAIGVFQLDMPVGAAMMKYSILTIGDGLVAQIPALLGAMAAGLIVTRATDGAADRDLGDSIRKQFHAVPRVTLVAGAICFLLALVPGFPTLVFAVLGAALSLVGGLLKLLPSTTKREEKRFPEPVEALDTSRDGTLSIDRLRQAMPLLLEAPGGSIALGARDAVESRLMDAVRRVELELGFRFPPLRFHWRRGGGSGWSLHAYEVPIVSGGTRDGLAPDTVAEAIGTALRRHAGLFLGIQESGEMLAQAGIEYPDIVKEVLRNLPAQNLATIFRNLVDEGVPLRNLRGVLEALVSASQHDKDVANLTEFARISQARQTCHRLAPDGRLRAITLAPSLEDRLIGRLRSTSGQQSLDIDAPTLDRLRRELAAAVDRHGPTAILVNLQLRRHLRQSLGGSFGELPFLSYNELVPTLALEIAARVDIEPSVTLAAG